MKLLCLNVAIFEQNNDKLESYIRSNQPDFVTLQEVTRSFEPSTFPEYLSKPSIDKSSAHLPFRFYGPLSEIKEFWKSNFHKHEKFEVSFGGFLEFGNYVKSTYPIVKARNIFVQNEFTLATDFSHFPEEDYRAVQVIDCIVKSKMVRILNYHGIWTQDKQGNTLAIKACEQIRSLALEENCPVIIAGDFNLFPDTKGVQLLSNSFRNLSDEFMIMSTRPTTNELSHIKRNVIDYIFVNDKIAVKEFKVPNVDVSDHLPLILEFELLN